MNRYWTPGITQPQEWMGQRLVANGDYDAGNIMGSDNCPSGQFHHRHELKKLPRERTVVAESHKRLSVLRVQTSFTVSKPRTVKEHNDLVGDKSHTWEPLLGGDNSTPPWFSLMCNGNVFFFICIHSVSWENHLGGTAIAINTCDPRTLGGNRKSWCRAGNKINLACAKGLSHCLVPVAVGSDQMSDQMSLSQSCLSSALTEVDSWRSCWLYTWNVRFLSHHQPPSLNAGKTQMSRLWPTYTAY